VGGTVGAVSIKWETDDESSLGFLLGPTIRYYFPVSDRILVNLAGDFMYVSFKPTSGGIRVDDAITQIALGGGIEAGYLIIPNLSIGIGARFSHFFEERSAGESSDNTDYNLIDIGLVLRIHIEVIGGNK
jgi:hypothetical protein